MPAPRPRPPIPLLFLDVDGPLIPFGGTREQYPDGYPTYGPARRPRLPAAETNPLLPRINPALGPRLAALPCELVWATTWMDEANECVSPWLGLPALPVVNWPEPAPDDPPDPPGVHWKTRPLVELAALPTFVLSGSSVTCVRASSGRSGRHGRDNRVATGWAPLIDRSDGG
ncbi:hypothetical protein [Streptomyces sp. NBC_01538]|uniref:hypothetical protein n=1 Tax=Streptomyces sp. NBC_01538 TaxID=2903897 RepID=UPI00386D1A5C